MLKDLKKKNGIFGRYKGIVRTIEYQKRGLPHLHLLLLLDDEHGNFATSNHIDEIISAELPDKNTHPDLYKIVTGNMMHGPCGKIKPNSPCMILDVFGNKFVLKASQKTINRKLFPVKMDIHCTDVDLMEKAMLLGIRLIDCMNFTCLTSGLFL